MVKNRECPECVKVGRDSKGDHLFLMGDEVTWCCNKPYHKPYFEREGGPISTKPRKLTPEEIIEIINEAKTFQILGNPERKISKETHEHFRVRTEVSESTGQPVAVWYPETTGGMFLGYKKRLLPKKFATFSKPNLKGKIPDFFGQAVCPKVGQRLLITGGEEDTLAFYEVMKSRYPEQTPCVVSLPRGEDTSEAIIANNLSFLKGFDQVIVGTDMDEAGRKALVKIIPIIGADRSRVLEISEKDCSDMHCKGKQKELVNAFFNAKEYRPANIVDVSEILERAITPVKWGLSYPWDQMTKYTYGLKSDVGEIIGLGAAPGKQLPL